MNSYFGHEADTARAERNLERLQNQIRRREQRIDRWPSGPAPLRRRRGHRTRQSRSAD
ncbi:hypothetical protein WP1_240 [Pseudomonas phage WP1]